MRTNKIFHKTTLIIVNCLLALVSVSANYTVNAFNKFSSGLCETNFVINLNGDAGPFDLEIFNIDQQGNNQSVLYEADLIPDAHIFNISAYGNFLVVITDDLGCSKEFELEAICACDDLEFNITNPSCHTNNGTFQIEAPLMGVVNVDWTSWPSGVVEPSGVYVNNMGQGSYTASFHLSYPDGNGGFYECSFDRTFYITQCQCELAMYPEHVDILNSLNCINPNGGFSVPDNFGIDQLLDNVAGNFTDLQFDWYNNGQLIQSSNSFNIDDLSSGEYILEITDEAGCTVSESFAITNDIEIFSSVSINNSCVGSSDGSACISVAVFPYNISSSFQYDWGQGFVSDNCMSNLATGNYTVTILETHSQCESVVNVDVQEVHNEEITFAHLDYPSIICPGETLIGNLDVEGGSPPYEVTLTNSAGARIVDNLFTIPLEDGQNTFDIVDRCGETFQITYGIGLEPYEPLSSITLDPKEGEEVPCNWYDDMEVELSWQGGNQPYNIYEEYLNQSVHLLTTTLPYAEFPLDGNTTTYKVVDNCGNEISITKEWSRCEAKLNLELRQLPNPNSSNGRIFVTIDNEDCDINNLCTSISCPACDDVGADFWFIKGITYLGFIDLSEDEMQYVCLPEGEYEFFVEMESGCILSKKIYLPSSTDTPESDCDPPQINASGTIALNSCSTTPPCGVGMVLTSQTVNSHLAGKLIHPTSITGTATITVGNTIAGDLPPIEIFVSAAKNETPFSIDVSLLPAGLNYIELSFGGNFCQRFDFYKSEAECTTQLCWDTEDCCIDELIIYEYCYLDGDCTLWPNEYGPEGLNPDQLGLPPCPQDCDLENFVPIDEDCYQLVSTTNSGNGYFIPFGDGTSLPGIILSTTNDLIVPSLEQVSPDGFLLDYANPLNNNGINSFNYLPLNAGVSNFGGLNAVVGTLNVQANSQSPVFIPFNYNFGTLPAVFISSNGGNTKPYVTQVTNTGFYVTVPNATSSFSGSTNSTLISFLAIETGVGMINDQKVLVGLSSPLNATDVQIDFNSLSRSAGNYFTNTPIVYSSVQNGSGSGQIPQYSNLNISGTTLNVVSANNSYNSIDLSNLSIGYFVIQPSIDCICLNQIQFDTQIVDEVCSSSNGQISIDILNGQAPFDYSVNGVHYQTPMNTISLLDLSIGDYVIEVIDVNGCSQSQTFHISDSGLPFDIEVRPTVSCPDTDFDVLIQVNEGTPPYSYLWSTGETSGSLQDVEYGTYSITVTDVNGCSGVQEFEIENTIVEVIKLDPFCGETNGSIEVIPEGNGPFAIEWNNGSTESKITNLAEGTYSVTVSNPYGCSYTESITLSNSNSLNITASGGNEGLFQNVYVEGGTTIDWAFNPYTVSDQLIITKDSEVVLNTGIVTRTSTCSCSTFRCDCSDYYLGDYSDETIQLITGSGYVATNNSVCAHDENEPGSVHPALTGSFYMATGGNLSIEVIGSNCGGSTSWSLGLSCDGTSMQRIQEIELRSNLEDSVESTKNHHEFGIVPNPFENTLTVTNLNQDVTYNVVLLDIHGKTVATYTHTGSTFFEMETKNLLSGIYFVNIQTEDNIQSFKAIKY